MTFRNEGKIPCVAVGHADQIEDDDPKAEITGLYFQRVNEGIVKPVLGTDLFSPVNWRNSRINLRRIRENFRADMQLNLIVPPPRWSRFATVMSELYSWMLERVSIVIISPGQRPYEVLTSLGYSHLSVCP